MTFEAQWILIRNTPLGDLQIRYYGIIVVLAMLVAATVAARLAQRRGYDPDHVWGGLTWAILPGIIGARVWFILFPPINLVEQGRGTEWLLQNFFNPDGGAIAIWTGGLGIFGAVIGGLIGIYLYCSPYHNRIAFVSYVIFYPLTLVLDFIGWVFTWITRRIAGKETQRYVLPRFTSTFPQNGIPSLPWLDIAAVVMPLAQAIGRWANYVNQELYGSPTTLPWGITIDLEKRLNTAYSSPIDFPAATRFHPLFLYESLWSLGAFFVLLYLYNNYRNRFKPGDFALIYLLQYTFVRFFLEFLRVEIAEIGSTGINSSQATCIVVFVIVLVVFVVRRNTKTTQTYDEATVMPQMPVTTITAAA